VIEIEGRTYRLGEVFKHDSWAATAVYASADGKVVCKFQRRAALLGLPMKWLGRLLARHEIAMLRRLQDAPGVPRCVGPVCAFGKELDNAVAHEFVAGHALRYAEAAPDEFFPRLQELVSRLHARGMAYVDLHKRENVLVGDDGFPYLVDFQISVALPGGWLGKAAPLRALLRLLQRSDDYHLLKHFAICRPDLCGVTFVELEKRRPWWIRAHRKIADPLRVMRRRLLVALRVRSGAGCVWSETFPEAGHREENVYGVH
jgi:hypothetical protein